MSDYDILSIICTAEAAGELDGSIPHALKTTRKYWVPTSTRPKKK